jgi:hypothetical protein
MVALDVAILAAAHAFLDAVRAAGARPEIVRAIQPGVAELAGDFAELVLQDVARGTQALLPVDEALEIGSGHTLAGYQTETKKTPAAFS